jgi:DNA repair photolyase
MRREVEKYRPGLVRMSPILTDPYQPVEKRYRITRQALEVLQPAGFTPVILTRAARVREDLDLLAKFPRAAVGFSIPTDDDRVRQAFEPGADPVDERFEALAECAAKGIYTFGVIQPMLPMNAERMVEKMAPHVRAIRIDRMHLVDRNLHLYREAGLVEAASDDFFDRTERTLIDGFTAHGVRIDHDDNLEVMLGELMR